MRLPSRTEAAQQRRPKHYRTRPSTRPPTTDSDITLATIAHLRRALTASTASDAAGVKAALFRATRTIDETYHPDIAAAIRTARSVDPVSRTVRQYIRELLRRLVAVVNYWEPSK
ncbi:MULTISPECIES: hypothetical protein [unclassified Halorubrum]|uniref:hypothetical protein n=1 Tax=unclassified Halorubrum TaxID=2642239 RepID=UPI0010F443B5|nr:MULTISPECIES: hypothetical protein [unclassified Halorubrum]TKX36041.1 hypothetical protein EXE52_17280 [Halorubrum sp. CGM4_25_10-8A]TKX62528.1 hypothetical protein EXE47_15720 [Halorubrum sp. GN12_10-3_MGM]